MGRPRVDTTPAKPCAACGKMLVRKTINGRLEDNAVFGRRKHCDQRCMAAGMVQEVVSVATSRERATRNHRESACRLCGTSHNLHVHHIDKNPLNNDLGNLATLCFRCHMKVHRDPQVAEVLIRAMIQAEVPA